MLYSFQISPFTTTDKANYDKGYVTHRRFDVKFDDLITNYMADMYDMAVRLTGSQHVAEDLVQDLFVNLRVRQVTTDHVNNPRAWLASILYRKFVDWWRKEKRSPVKLGSQLSEEENQALYNVQSNERDPLAQLEMKDKTDHIIAALENLSEDHRCVVIMHDIEGYSLPELQEIMDVPLGTLKSRLHRARERLSLELNHHRSHNLKETGS